MIKYLLDANIFIQAKNLHYGLDFCPAFWDWLIEQNQSGRLVSIDKVETELTNGNDDLAQWVTGCGAAFFLPTTNTSTGDLARVSRWATNGNYNQGAINKFLGVADYWLVAFGLAHGYTIVTHEKAAASPHKIKIPDACAGLSIPCISPFEMLRTEKARFILEQVTGR